MGLWRWYVHQGNNTVQKIIVTHVYRFVKQAPERKWFSDASFDAIGGLWLETAIHWRYQLTEEVNGGRYRVKLGKVTGHRLAYQRG